MHDEDERTGGDERDRREIRDRIVREFFVETHIDCVSARNEDDRIAVGRRARRDFGADDAVRAGPAVDDDLLLQVLAEPGRNDAADRVIATAGRKRRNDADRLGGIRLRGNRRMPSGENDCGNYDVSHGLPRCRYKVFERAERVRGLQSFRNCSSSSLLNDRKFNPALFERLADGDGLALIQRCRTLRREACCARARPIAMPVTSRWRES